MKTYLVWNSTKTECVGFKDYNDAYYTANGRWPEGYRSAFYPTLGMEFRDYYTDEVDTLPMTEVTDNV